MNIEAALLVYGILYGRTGPEEAAKLEALMRIIGALPIPEAQRVFLMATVTVDTNHRFIPMTEVGTPKQYDHLAGLLGNRDSKDAYKYRPRGYNRVTGRAAYEAIKQHFGADVVAKPEQLTTNTDLALAVLIRGALEGTVTDKRLDEFTAEGIVDVELARRGLSTLGDRVQPMKMAVGLWTRAFYRMFTVPLGKTVLIRKKPSAQK